MLTISSSPDPLSRRLHFSPIISLVQILIPLFEQKTNCNLTNPDLWSDLCIDAMWNDPNDMSTSSTDPNNTKCVTHQHTIHPLEIFTIFQIRLSIFSPFQVHFQSCYDLSQMFYWFCQPTVSVFRSPSVNLLLILWIYTKTKNSKLFSSPGEQSGKLRVYHRDSLHLPFPVAFLVAYPIAFSVQNTNHFL